MNRLRRILLLILITLLALLLIGLLKPTALGMEKNNPTFVGLFFLANQKASAVAGAFWFLG